MAEEWRAGKLTQTEAMELQEELDAIASKVPLPTELKALRRDLASARMGSVESAVSGGTA
jgi:hypothetical protein